MTKEEALARLRYINTTLRDDPECAHAEADAVLVNLLITLGCQDVADAYTKMADDWFWYA